MKLNDLISNDKETAFAKHIFSGNLKNRQMHGFKFGNKWDNQIGGDAALYGFERRTGNVTFSGKLIYNLSASGHSVVITDLAIKDHSTRNSAMPITWPDTQYAKEWNGAALAPLLELAMRAVQEIADTALREVGETP